MPSGDLMAFELRSSDRDSWTNRLDSGSGGGGDGLPSGHSEHVPRAGELAALVFYPNGRSDQMSDSGSGSGANALSSGHSEQVPHVQQLDESAIISGASGMSSVVCTMAASLLSDEEDLDLVSHIQLPVCHLPLQSSLHPSLGVDIAHAFRRPRHRCRPRHRKPLAALSPQTSPLSEATIVSGDEGRAEDSSDVDRVAMRFFPEDCLFDAAVCGWSTSRLLEEL